MSVRALIANGDACELRIDRRKLQAFHRDVGIHRRTIAEFVICGMRIGAGDGEFRDIGEGYAPRNLVEPLRIIGHGDGKRRSCRKGQERPENEDAADDAEG